MNKEEIGKKDLEIRQSAMNKEKKEIEDKDKKII